MQIQTELEYEKILANTGRPVHLVVKLTAPRMQTDARKTKAAFTVVLDRSGSMEGAPLEYAKRACRELVTHLRPEDQFGLVVFDDHAQVVIPMQAPGAQRQSMQEAIDRVQAGNSTNLMGGWLLGREELLMAGAGLSADPSEKPIRKLLVLTDGHLNCGITDPDQVEALTRTGLERDGIRTSCLGFGAGYNEDVLAVMSKVGHGRLHDADSPEKFPVILADELDGLQKLVVQNLRVRVQPKLFCDAWQLFGDYPAMHLADGRTELGLGDLVSGEERQIMFLLQVLPLPVLPDGNLPASLEGEELVDLEFVYTEVSEAGKETRIENQTSRHLIRIQATQNPEDVVQNRELIAVIANQEAAEATRQAAQEIGKGNSTAALSILQATAKKLTALGDPVATQDAAALLAENEEKLCRGELDTRSRKQMLYEAKFYAASSTAQLYTGTREKPKFSQKPSADEQLGGEKPTKD